MEMEVIVERCAFLDVHRHTVMACARTPDGAGGRSEEVAEFWHGFHAPILSAAGPWLRRRRCSIAEGVAAPPFPRPAAMGHRWVQIGAPCLSIQLYVVN